MNTKALGIDVVSKPQIEVTEDKHLFGRFVVKEGSNKANVLQSLKNNLVNFYNKSLKERHIEGPPKRIGE